MSLLSELSSEIKLALSASWAFSIAPASEFIAFLPAVMYLVPFMALANTTGVIVLFVNSFQVFCPFWTCSRERAMAIRESWRSLKNAWASFSRLPFFPRRTPPNPFLSLRASWNCFSVIPETSAATSVGFLPNFSAYLLIQVRGVPFS